MYKQHKMKRLFKLIFQIIQSTLDSILIGAARLNFIDRYQPLFGYTSARTVAEWGWLSIRLISPT